MRVRRLTAPVAVAIGLLAAVTAACGDPVPSPSPAALAATPLPPTGAPASETPPASTAAPGRAVEDPSLIAVLPADLDGMPVILESQAFTEAMADPDFARNIASAAFGVVVAGDDLATAVVARPVDGVFSETWFRDWRDSYNEGACAVADGVAGNAEAELGGRIVHIGSCVGGLRTYHTWIEERGLLVSAFAVGANRFGERLMEGLRP